MSAEIAPRNAKRLVNRFRINLLIANRRGLLTSEPKITPRQIGKWMVLLERWPQLGRSLSAVPEKMKIMEDDSILGPKAKVVKEEPSSTAAAVQDASEDQFMQTVRSLAEPYVGDEDLRNFIRSDPLLATVLQRLVHYGSNEPSA
jgi:hypothetical protein